MIIPAANILLGQEVLQIHYSMGSEWVFVCFEYSQHWFGNRPWLALAVFRGLWLLSWWLGLAPWWLWHFWRAPSLRKTFVIPSGFRTSSVYYIILVGVVICLLWPGVLISYWPAFVVIFWVLMSQVQRNRRSHFL